MRRLPSGRRGWLLALAASLVLCPAISVGGTAPDAPPLATWVAPEVDVDGLLQEDATRGLDEKLPSRVGFPMDVDLSPSNVGAWEELPDGGRLWRLQVRSPGALWVVLGFDEFRLTPGAELRVYDAGSRRERGAYTFEDVRPHGQLWVPPIAGDTLVLELQLSRARANDDPAIHLGTVSHGYRPWGGIGAPQPLGAGSCHQDINCPPGDDWQLQKRGVVLLLIGGGAGSCTGSLINNTSLDCTPYVLTAKHCLDGQSLPGVMFQFHYEQPICEPGVPAELIKTGAIARASGVASDFQLIEMEEGPDADWNVFFNGWSRSTQAATESWTIHHPMGDVKKITHDADSLVDGIDQGPDHWRVNQWEEGSTDPGSSGGPLFDQNRRIVGQLDVDTAACDNQGGFAEFGKFDVSWNLGLSPFLDPPACGTALCGVTELDGMDQSFCGAPAPRLSHAGHVVDDSGGSNNGVADPGETFGLEIQLHNDGPLAATSVSGTLSTTEPLVTIVNDAATWPGISPYEAQGSVAPHFTIDLDLGFVCGNSIPLQLSVTSAEGNGQSDFLVPTGSVVGLLEPPPFEDDMESGQNGWTESTLIGSTPWSLISGESNSPTHSWHVPNVVGIRDSVLIMPTVASMPPRATLSFAHRMISELGDGGVLEYSTDGFTWIDAGDLITLGPYNSIIPTGFSSPIAGRAAWAGDLGGWRTVDVDLSSLEGQPVMLRWRFASDTFSGNVGWHVDDVVLNSPEVLCLPCADVDDDGFCPAPLGNDCDDVKGDVYPGAPQICDALNNDCSDAAWPSLPANESDGDADGSTSCAGDCNGADPTVHLGAGEVCDGRDNDCDGLLDNDVACDRTCDQPEIAGGDVLITADPASSAQAGVVWTGVEFGVAWSDARDGNFEIYFSRLDPFGQATAGELRVTDAQADSINASLVWNGDEYAMSWCDGRAGPLDAYFARLDASGVKLGADVLLGGGCQNNGITSLAWNGSEYAVAWVDSTSEIRLVRLDASGVPIGGETQLSDGSGSSRYPSLVWSGTEYGLAWHALDGSFNQIYFTRADAFGNEVGSDVAVTSNSIHSRLPSLVWDGTGYGIAWNEGTGAGGARFIRFARLDGSGSPLGGVTPVTGAQTGSRRPTVAWSGEEYGLVWRDLRDGNGEVYFARLDAAGTEIGAEARLTDTAADSEAGNIVWTGTEFGVVWSETPEIHFYRVGCNCFDLDGDGRSDCNDNCSETFNPSQSDFDADFQGDHCDLDDGLVYLRFSNTTQAEWQLEQGFDSWNFYKGDLDVLEASLLYTQLPGSNDLADRQCGLSVPSAGDLDPPDPGKTAFFLTAGVSGGVEGGLGPDSTGENRPNDNPCPP